MKQSELIQLLENPQKAVASDLQKIEALRNEFPFFQSAHMLLTYIAKKYNSSLYQQTLRNTAIAIPNRARLHSLVHEEAEEQIAKILEENTPEDVKKVKATEVLEAVEIETKPLENVEEFIPPSEIEHLKAIELITDIPEKTKDEELTEQVEKEIEKQIVNSFIEKEVLKTPDAYKNEPKREKLDSGSFSDWMKALKKMDRAEEEEHQKEEERKPVQPKTKSHGKKEEQKSIIDKVIESNPGNIRLNTTQKFFAADNKAKESLFENEDLVTETLAKIYALQGNINKAIRAYEILSLKFPQKSAYFASLIENLKKGNQ